MEATDLFLVAKDGVNKFIESKYKRDELFEKAKVYLTTPVRKAGYIDKTQVTENMVFAGETALSEKTMLNPSRVVTYAISEKDYDKTLLTDELIDPDKQVGLNYGRTAQNNFQRITVLTIFHLFCLLQIVVEDDENLNRGITFSLKKSGYEVFSAESVKKAKRIASDNHVDVTICDVNLPDGNGLEFVRWMRCNYNTYYCLTALDQETDQVMGYEAGADDYMTKPFSLSVLLLKSEAHFRRRQEKTEAGKMISEISYLSQEK